MEFNLLACSYPKLVDALANILEVYGVLHYSRMQMGVVAMHKHLETCTEQST